VPSFRRSRAVSLDVNARLRGAGYADANPFDAQTSTPNKEARVQTVVLAASRRPVRARQLIEALLVPLRVGDHLKWAAGAKAPELGPLQSALRRAGWSLSDDGELSVLELIDLTLGGREAAPGWKRDLAGEASGHPRLRRMSRAR